MISGRNIAALEVGFIEDAALKKHFERINLLLKIQMKEKHRCTNSMIRSTQMRSLHVNQNLEVSAGLNIENETPLIQDDPTTCVGF